MSREQEIADYVAERNAILESGDVGRLIEFSREHLPAPFSSRYVAEIALHKMRTAVTTLPLALRRESYRWLKERGIETYDDGGLAE